MPRSKKICGATGGVNIHSNWNIHHRILIFAPQTYHHITIWPYTRHHTCTQNSPTITPPSLSYFLVPSCFPMLSLSLEKLLTCGVARSYNLHIYIHIHTYIRTYVHSYIHTFIQSYIHTYTHTYIHTYVHTYIHTYTHTYIHTFTHTHIYIYIYTHTYLHIYIYIYIYISRPHPPTGGGAGNIAPVYPYPFLLLTTNYYSLQLTNNNNNNYYYYYPPTHPQGGEHTHSFIPIYPYPLGGDLGGCIIYTLTFTYIYIYIFDDLNVYILFPIYIYRQIGLQLWSSRINSGYQSTVGWLVPSWEMLPRWSTSVYSIRPQEWSFRRWYLGVQLGLPSSNLRAAWKLLKCSFRAALSGRCRRKNPRLVFRSRRMW